MTRTEMVLAYLPQMIRKKIESDCTEKLESIEEIRIRTNKPLMIKIEQNVEVLDYLVNQQEVFQIFEKICENSVYSYRRQICEGYITIKGGNRVGIVGSAVIENGQVININYISSLNFRIARQKIGCSNYIIKDIINFKEQNIYNTLIIAPPRKWKNNIIKRYNKKFK